MNHAFFWAMCTGASAFVTLAHAQDAIGKGPIADQYMTLCASCHGADMTGGAGPSLVDDEWVHGSSPENIAAAIATGTPDNGMPGFDAALTPEEVRMMVILIREQKYLSEIDAVNADAAPQDGVFSTNAYDIELEKIISSNEYFWSINFLPDGEMIVTRRDGRLYFVRGGELHQIKGTPDVWANGQGGLLEVAPHPDYENNGWIYLSFSHAAGEENGREAGMLKVARGRIADNRWTDEETLFETPGEHHISTGQHFGSRFVFKDGYLFFGIGDRGRPAMSQDLSKPNGNIYRIHDDGRIPDDNPFVDTPGAYKAIWTYGHRNPQGMDMDPVTGAVYQAEHGPRGGDELNRLTKGGNYGWPIVSHGMNYDGTPVTDKTSAPGVEPPVVYWTPSIAVSAIDFYEGEIFSDWQNDLFVTGLLSEQLRRLRIKDGEVVEQEVIFKNQGRVREVANGPDGYLYVVLEERTPKGSAIYRVVPATE